MKGADENEAIHQSRAWWARVGTLMAHHVLEPEDPLYGPIRECVMHDPSIQRDLAHMSLGDLIVEMTNLIGR